MLTTIIRFFASPVFEDEEKQRVASLLNIMLNVMLGCTLSLALVFTLLAASFLSDWRYALIIGGLVASILVMRFLLRHGNIQLASGLLSAALLAGTTLSIYSSNGIRDVSTSGYLVCIIIAGLLLGGRGAIIFTLLSLAALLGVWYADLNGLLNYDMPKSPQLFDGIAYGAIFIISGLLLRYAVSSITQSLERAHRNERAQVKANRELEKLRASLEQQVADRTRDLERRTNYLEASAEVSRAASSILDIDQLTRQVVELIRERFGLYYVGLFLADQANGWAVLRAGTGEAGRAMLSRGHRLPIGGSSVVGQSIADAQPRVAQETDQGAGRLATEELPSTRAEAALPLHSRGQVIGALTVQSDRLDVFDNTAMAALQSMADQVATALDNARLFAESQAALEAERRAYGQMSLEAWAQMLRGGLTPGYRYINRQVMPIGNESSDSIKPSDSGDRISLPIKVHGQVIGVVELQSSKGASEEAALLQTLTEQLGTALESARLYQDTQRRAAREQLTGAIAARMRESLDMEAVLKTAASEMRRALGLDRIIVRLAREEADKKSAPM
jgi:GAF domain-containing protein